MIYKNYNINNSLFILNIYFNLLINKRYIIIILANFNLYNFEFNQKIKK